MKVKINRTCLNDALRRIAPGANAKSTTPILGNVKMVAGKGVVALTTTDLFITLHTEIPCEVVEEGGTTIPIRMLCSIVSAMSEGIVEIEQKANKARVVCGSFVTQVGTHPIEQFPVVKKDDADCRFVVSVKVIRDMLRRTSYAQSTDGTRTTLNGVLFEFSDVNLRCVATDGRRLAVAETDGDFKCKGTFRYIIPASTVANLMKFVTGDGELEIVASRGQIRFVLDGGSNEIISRLVDGVYPNYVNVIPTSNDKIVEVDRSDLIGAVERVSVMAVRIDSCVKMTMSDNKMLVEVKGDDLCDAHDEIPIRYEGEKVEIIFNPRYVLDYLRASDSDVIKMEFKDGSTAANFRSATERYLCTLMPLKVATM